MRVVTLNANGIRAAQRKGFFSWLSRQRADVCCIQETKAQVHQLTDPAFHPRKHHCFYVDAQKKGYSGVAMYSRHEPTRVIRTLAEAAGGDQGWQEFDDEGRYLELQFGDLSIVSLYLPSGSSSEERQAAKFRFLDLFMPHLADLKKQGRDYILCGDWNIAHKQIDLKNWRSNQKNSGFLPEERAWMDQLFRRDGLRGRLSRAQRQEPTSTPGGPTAARPGPTTWAGASTTRSPRRRWKASRRKRASTPTSASRITRR